MVRMIAIERRRVCPWKKMTSELNDKTIAVIRKARRKRLW
jgi:hypothetical protein